MKIVMKEYNLDAFKEKDVYDWEEIIAVLEEQESKIKELEEPWVLLQTPRLHGRNAGRVLE